MPIIELLVAIVLIVVYTTCTIVLLAGGIALTYGIWSGIVKPTIAHLRRFPGNGEE